MPDSGADPDENDQHRTPATMREIAQKSGVSESTASRVMSPATRHLVATETQEKVLVVAEELGHRPGASAQTWRRSGSRRTPVIGVIARDLSDTFFAFLAGAVIKEARAAGKQVLMGDADSRATQARALEEILETRRCEAILLLGDVADAALLGELQETRLPVLGLCGGDRTRAASGDRGVPFLNSDNGEGVFELMRRLLGLGHRKVAFVRCQWDADILARRDAYVEFMDSHGLDHPPEYIQNVSNDSAGGAAAMLALLDLKDRPTAVVAGTDNMAIGCIQAAWHSGKNVPNDISVVGFDGLPVSSFTWPSLATMRQNVEEIARVGLMLLGEQVATGRLIQPNPPPIRPVFKEGNSLGPVSKAGSSLSIE